MFVYIFICASIARELLNRFWCGFRYRDRIDHRSDMGKSKNQISSKIQDGRHFSWKNKANNIISAINVGKSSFWCLTMSLKNLYLNSKNKKIQKTKRLEQFSLEKLKYPRKKKPITAMPVMLSLSRRPAHCITGITAAHPERMGRRINGQGCHV